MHTTSDNDLFHRLAFDNPWWAFTDETTVKFRNAGRRVFFNDFHTAKMKPGAGRVLTPALYCYRLGRDPALKSFQRTEK